MGARDLRGGFWRLAHGRALALDRSRILAILNVTPDSFSDGGALSEPGAVVRRAREAIQEGADGLDIGAESTRPGASGVGADEQISRAIPAIRALRDAGVCVPITIDTTSARVAAAALEAGADGVNDQSGGRDDPGMLALIAGKGAGCVLMHRLGAPARDRYSDRHEAPPDYAGVGGVTAGVRAFLEERVAAALGAGVGREAIVVDPGLGFGKSVEQNYKIIREIGRAAPSGYPVLCGASRKSFLGAVSGEGTPSRRVVESAAAAVAARLGGAQVFRVHDVAAHRAALTVADAALSGRG